MMWDIWDDIWNVWDDGGHIWIHEGVWEYMGGRGYVGIRADECGRPASNIKWLMSPPF